MHRSRLSGFIIDCNTQQLDQAADFWSHALGFPSKDSSADEDVGYRLLDARPVPLNVELQQVDHPSGVHLDIESDDVEAEVLRLEALGATRLRQVRSWWVMQAPTGHRFCVVPMADGDDRPSNQWDK